MKILYSSSEIRKAITHLFSTAKGRRVAITAFVGADAENYLTKPKGIELICWPKAGGTNPYAIWQLKKQGVKVYFADSLHMKLYWTEDRGAVVTSANLSTFALGSGGLKEIGVLLPSGSVDIDRVLEKIDYQKATETAIEKLEVAHKNYAKQNVNNYPKKANSNTFAQWYKARKPEWKLMPLAEEEDLKLCSSAKTLLKVEHGKTSCYQIFQMIKGDEKYYKENDWLFGFSEAKKSLLPMSWTFAHYIVKIPSTDKAIYDPEWPRQLLQVAPLRAYDSPPFSIDSGFKKAFRLALDDFGGVSKVNNARTKRPSEKLLTLIYKHYTK